MNKNINEKNAIIGLLCGFTCELFFGFSFMFTKNITSSVNVLYLLGWRFLTAFLLMTLLIIFKVIKVDYKGKNPLKLLVISFLVPVAYFLSETYGIKLTTASESGTIIACIPVVSILVAFLISKTRPTLFQVGGILVTLLGVLMTVFAASTSVSFSLLGYVLLFIAVLSYSFYSTFTERFKEYSSIEKTYSMLGVGAFVFIAIALIRSFIYKETLYFISLPIKNSDFLIAVLYLSIGCSVLAFLFSNISISRVGVARYSSFVGVSTVCSVLSGVLFLKDNLSALQIAGIIVIIIGIYVANISKDLFKRKSAGGK